MPKENNVHTYCNVFLFSDCEFAEQLTSGADNSKIKRFADTMAVADELIDAGEIPLDEVVYLPVVFTRKETKAKPSLEGRTIMQADGTQRTISMPATQPDESVPFSDDS